MSKAARRIGRTQSATSHALARLRDALADPLLVRVGADMVATPRAERLQDNLRRILRSLHRVLEGEVEFDPASTERVLSVAGPDFLAAHAPAIVSGLTARAPSARFEFMGPSPGMFQDLIDGRIDLVVSPPRRHATDGVTGVELASLDWVVFMRKDHPAAARWGIKAWTSYSHLQVRTGADKSPVDVALERAGKRRTVAAWLPSFHVAAPLIAQTDLLFAAPRAALGELPGRYALRALRCPVRLPPILLHLHYATHLSRDPAVMFFVDVVADALQEMFSDH